MGYSRSPGGAVVNILPIQLFIVENEKKMNENARILSAFENRLRVGFV